MAVDYILKIDGVDGESTDGKHAKEIDVESWSWGATQTGASASRGAGGGAGKVSMQDFHVTKKADQVSTQSISFTQKVDKSTPKL